MRRPILAMALALACARAGAAEWLVTPAEAVEMGGAQGYEAPMPLRGRSATPRVELVRPDLGAQPRIRPPVSIAVRFVPLPDAPIDPASFRVFYGAMKFDITSRLERFVSLTPTGFSLENAQIPPGRHRLLVQVRDDKQRVAEADLRFEVE
ncbi:hypothetical protein ACT80S_06035 [Ramlibacter sp. MAHUQ-53]|uniref:hypothetical protein n=1 Tax=unclassified Ramlibacter TaxID=2617605 RepID=UPI0036436ED9